MAIPSHGVTGKLLRSFKEEKNEMGEMVVTGSGIFQHEYFVSGPNVAGEGAEACLVSNLPCKPAKEVSWQGPGSIRNELCKALQDRVNIIVTWKTWHAQGRLEGGWVV